MSLLAWVCVLAFIGWLAIIVVALMVAAARADRESERWHGTNQG